MNERGKTTVIYAGGEMGRRGDRRGPQGGLAHVRSQLADLWPADFLKGVDWQEFTVGDEHLSLNTWSAEAINALAQMVGAAHESEANGVVVVAEGQLLVPAAASLAYQFEGLQKPVVFTGSVRTLDQSRTDAVQNLAEAIELARQSGVDPAVPRIPEVLISAHNHVYRAVQARHVSEQSYDQFDTQSHRPLAEFLGEVRGLGLRVDRREIAQWPADAQQFQVHQLDPTKHVVQISTAAVTPDAGRRSLDIAAQYGDGLIVTHPLGSDGPLVELARAYPDLPIVCSGKLPADLPNLLPQTSDLDAATTHAKLHYLLSRTGDIQAIRALYLANLRGEGTGPLQSEQEVLRSLNREQELRRLPPMR